MVDEFVETTQNTNKTQFLASNYGTIRAQGPGGNKKLGACTFWVGTYSWQEYNLGELSHFLSPNIHGNCK